MTKEELALEIIDRLKKEYPDAGCTLDYDQAWKLLVSVRLAAQCTDARVNVVVEDLFAKYPSVDALAEAEPEEIEKIVSDRAFFSSSVFFSPGMCFTPLLTHAYQPKAPYLLLSGRYSFSHSGLSFHLLVPQKD